MTRVRIATQERGPKCKMETISQLSRCVRTGRRPLVAAWTTARMRLQCRKKTTKLKTTCLKWRRTKSISLSSGPLDPTLDAGNTPHSATIKCWEHRRVMPRCVIQYAYSVCACSASHACVSEFPATQAHASLCARPHLTGNNEDRLARSGS